LLAGNFKDAESILLNAIQSKKPKEEDIYNYALILEVKGKYDEAMEKYTLALGMNEDSEERLRRIGVRDSKNLGDATIAKLGVEIQKILGRGRYEVIWISPLKYNLLHKKMKNVNRILGWGHARAIENLLSNTCYGDKNVIKLQVLYCCRRIDPVTIKQGTLL